MKIKTKFLYELVTFLFEQAYEDMIVSTSDIDDKYFEGKRNAFETIKFLLEGDNEELLDILEQIRAKRLSQHNTGEDMPF